MIKQYRHTEKSELRMLSEEKIDYIKNMLNKLFAIKYKAIYIFLVIIMYHKKVEVKKTKLNKILIHKKIVNL